MAPDYNILPTHGHIVSGASEKKFDRVAGYCGNCRFCCRSYSASQQIACGDCALASEIEQTVTAGGSILSYDAESDRYNYVWKTEKS
jgi:hypothetical protein